MEHLRDLISNRKAHGSVCNSALWLILILMIDIVIDIDWVTFEHIGSEESSMSNPAWFAWNYTLIYHYQHSWNNLLVWNALWGIMCKYSYSIFVRLTSSVSLISQKPSIEVVSFKIIQFIFLIVSFTRNCVRLI